MTVSKYVRTNPRILDTIVPAAMTMLARRNDPSAGASGAADVAGEVMTPEITRVRSKSSSAPNRLRLRRETSAPKVTASMSRLS